MEPEPWRTSSLGIEPEWPPTEPGAAIDREDLSRDETGVVGDEIRDRVSHVLRFSPALERDALSDLEDSFRCVPELLRGAGCFDRTGRYGVHPDVVARPFDSKRLRHRHHARLRSCRVHRAGAAGPYI